MSDFVHERHKPPTALQRTRPLVVACPQMRSNINLSRIVRAASCCGVTKLIACGSGKVDAKIARDGATEVTIDVRRSLPPVLQKLKSNGYALVGLEQTTNSVSIHSFAFPHQSVLVVGHERHGIEDDVLQLLDHVIEIPVYGLPYSYNAATATCMALYEYCRQFPDG